MRVLVVDDCADTTDSLCMLLRMKGLTTDAAYDGPTALALAREHQPDAVLLDLGMPHFDGLTVARSFRQELGLGDTLIIAITGFAGEDDRRRALEAGFDAYLIKPVNFQELLAMLGVER